MIRFPKDESAIRTTIGGLEAKARFFGGSIRFEPKMANLPKTTRVDVFPSGEVYTLPDSNGFYTLVARAR